MARSSAPVAVEIAGGERGAEIVTRLRRAGHARHVLVPQLRARAGEASARAIQHVHRAGAQKPDAIEADADRQVAVAIVVEVADRQAAAERIASPRRYPGTSALSWVQV